MSCFFLRLEHFASNQKEEDVVRDLVEIAKRLDLSVQAELNGIEITVYPESTPDQAVRAYVKAVERNVKFAAAI